MYLALNWYNSLYSRTSQVIPVHMGHETMVSNYMYMYPLAGSCMYTWDIWDKGV